MDRVSLLSNLSSNNLCFIVILDQIRSFGSLFFQNNILCILNVILNNNGKVIFKVKQDLIYVVNVLGKGLR